ncbi:hypothetical protein TTHERM_00670710 (macronuclear) [Tetrahymena thermophila SB210]|uniref:Uncharacterized protein n=1 Tax=Tetrahymena thermophila (strain SB210) TaxID=312017 RepID=I7LXT3_TETTS|nr:hypothetical protein TTHERM_00670710 [Tetrahymena thermophila SB210]EAS06147.2 hypothetical protein TTHERM_00670710 [Tetrahymena thermophila SB210]|eukprot:XP_001026392.2 hypothetical protein TTHERM_00670710 [Tetrahymena thermophila SB210]
MNHNLSEIKDLNSLSNRDSRSNYSIVSDDLGQQLLQLILEYQPNPQDQYLLELSKQRTVVEIDEKFRNSHINQTYTFPRKVTERDRNKARELQQILANSAQNSKEINKQFQFKETNKKNCQNEGIVNQEAKKVFIDDKQNFQFQNNENTDDSFSSLNDVSFYDLNSQNKICQKQIQHLQLNQPNHNVNSALQQMSKGNQIQVQKPQNQGNQQEQQNKIKHCYYTNQNNSNQQNLTQFIKTTTTNQKQQQAVKSHVQTDANKIKQSDIVQSNYYDNDMINIEINTGDNNNFNQNINISKEEIGLLQQQRQQNSKCQQGLKNNQVLHSTQLKKNTQIPKERNFHEMVSSNSNQLVDKQQIDNQMQRMPLTEKISNAKHLSNIDFINDAAQMQASSSTGTTTVIGEQVNLSKNKVNTNNSNKSDLNIKHSKMAFSQVEGVFTEADEIDEDTQHQTREEWVQSMIDQKAKADSSKQQKIGWMYTEGDIQNKSPQKQYYNVPTTQQQQVNAKVRKLKIASFHQGQKDQNQKLIQSLSLHNQFDQISNMPNTNHALPQTVYNKQNFQQKSQNQNFEKTNFSNQLKMGGINTNFLYDINEIQINTQLANLTSKSSKQENIMNTCSATQQPQEINKVIKYPFCIQNNLNNGNNNNAAFKQQNYLSENKLSKIIQSQQMNQTQQNTVAQNNIQNLSQTSKIINMSLDYQTQDTRFTPLRSNKIPSQVNRNNSQLQNPNSTSHLNNYISCGDEKNRSVSNSNNLEYSLSKSTKNKNLNISLSVTKGSALKDEPFQQEAIQTQSQFNQIHKRNQASIRKLRPKINFDGMSNDFSDLIPTSSKEQNFTQIDLSPYTQISKHIRSNTINNYHMKPPTTKNSHQRQPSDNALRSSATNRVVSEQSQEKIKTANFSSCANEVDGNNSSNKVMLADSTKSNVRFPQTYNNQKVKRTLKIQSCKYNSQKNQLLQEQFRNSNQYHGNMPNSTKNTYQIQPLQPCFEDELTQNKNAIKLEQQKLSMLRKENLNSFENKARFSQSQQQSNQLNQQKHILSNKSYLSKEKPIKEAGQLQNYERRYLKTDGDDQNDGSIFLNDNILFQNSKEFDKNSQVQISLHKNYSANSEFNLNEFSGKKITKQNFNQNCFKEDKFQQNSKSKSEENRISLKSNQVQAVNTNQYDQVKKKYFHKTNSIGKSLTSTQPLTLDSYSTDNPTSNQQSDNYSINSNSNNKQKASCPQKQESTQNIKDNKNQVLCYENTMNSYNNKCDEESKVSNSEQTNQRISSKIKKAVQNINEENFKNEECEEKQIQISKKPEQLNQILVQHMHKETKPQQQNQNGVRQVKKMAYNTSANNKNAYQNMSYTQESQNFNQDSQVQNRKLVACSLHEDNLKSYQIDPISKQPLLQQENSNQLQKLEYLKSSAISTASTQIGVTQQKVINKTVAYDSIQVKQNNNPSALRQKAAQTPSSLSVNTDQQINGVNNLTREIGSTYLGSHVTACSTQSNQSKNKSPLKQNLILPTNLQNNNGPVLPQYSSSTRNQNTVSLFKKKSNQLYSSVSYQSQNQTNLSTQL